MDRITKDQIFGKTPHPYYEVAYKENEGDKVVLGFHNDLPDLPEITESIIASGNTCTLQALQEINAELEERKGYKTDEETLQHCFREMLLALIAEYDSSAEVNSFTLNGDATWFSKDVRASLSARFASERRTNAYATTIWTGEKGVRVPVREAQDMMARIELYASQCHDTGMRHKMQAQCLETVQEMMEYDYRSGYPEKLEFSIDMYNRNKRNILGAVIFFVLGLLISGFATVIAILREKHQSDKGGFELESDDLVRYSVASGIGAAVQAAGLLLWLCLA